MRAALILALASCTSASAQNVAELTLRFRAHLLESAMSAHTGVPFHLREQSHSPLRPMVGGLFGGGGKYPWHEVQTTIFWPSEQPRGASCYDPKWAANAVHESPFFASVPWTDLDGHGGTKPEAALVVPWFKQTFRSPGVSVIRDKWIEVRYQGRYAFCQISDCGPYSSTDAAFVFGDRNARPAPHARNQAGLDIGPTVAAYLGITDGLSVTSWKWCDDRDVPQGPWRHSVDTAMAKLDRRAK